MRRYPRNYVFALAFVLPAVLSGGARAQSIDEAIQLYKNDKHEEAAFSFYDVLRNDADAGARDQAEIYLADSLRKMQLYIPALFYYTDVYKAGKAGRYYSNAIEGLLSVQEQLHDPLFVPTLLSQQLTNDSFSELNDYRIAQAHFLVGELSLRRGKGDEAKSYLERVPRDHALYTKARYLLGVAAVRANHHEAALAHFLAVMEFLKPKGLSRELADVRGLAQIAAARTAYGLGRYEQAAELYGSVERFSTHWFTAMYESAWAHFRDEEYGKALGELQSVASPYFAKRHLPEAYVIQSTAYFANCQWDRVRASVAQYKKLYDPMSERLDTYLKTERELPEYYRDVVTADDADTGKLPVELARAIRRHKRFVDYHFVIEHMSWELQQVANADVWKNSRLADDLKAMVTEHKEQLETAVGTWVQSRLSNLQAQMQNFANQIAILDFEVADAERQWLEQGREILRGRRARLPRPEIPNDQWQHWNFKDEFWQDELGYYQYTIRTECE